MKISTGSSCILFFLALSFSVHAQDLVKYGDNSISKQEFVRAFLKNNYDQQKSEKAYRDYLELYVRFKLKVKAAYDLKMDTLPNQKAELTEFRRQIAEGFLNDDTSFKKLVEEAFLRSQKDIHLAHIFISNNAGGTAATTDTIKAWKLASAAFAELKKGSDFAKVASVYSSDSSVRLNHGDIGYITAFTLPYELENLAYTTPVGSFSKIYHSKAGYHIFKNLGERKALGKIKAAQILLAYPNNAGNAAKDVIKLRADSIYNALQQGASFNALLNKYNTGNTSSAANGEMLEFGVGNFDEAFETSVFALTKDNAISKPISTSIGYHIVKRIEQVPVNSNPADDSAMAVLKQQVRSDSRMELSRKVMLQKIFHVTGFRKAVLPEKDFWIYTDSSLKGRKPSGVAPISGKTLLFSFSDKNIYAGDWINYLKSSVKIPANVPGEIVKPLLSQYEEILAREYYLDHLEKYDPEFADQVKEFKEGNLLFEIMQKNIWDKASVDSAGLRKYFEANKGKYWWEPGVDAVIFNCTDSSTAYAIRSTFEKNKDWRAVIAPFGAKAQADSGRFELSQLQYAFKGQPKRGLLTEALKNVADNNISFLYIVNEHPLRSARSFEDAKGFVLSDYQAYLEEKWIEGLKKRYPVKVNESLLRSLWK